jgi:stalled ribosome rescue protein Dom34
MTPKTYRRGYPVATLICLRQNQATIWNIYSKVAKPQTTVQITGQRTDSTALYNFQEAIINAVRPSVRQGIHSIIMTSPPRTNYAQDLLKHVKNHHSWLIQGQNKTIFAEITSTATTKNEITELIKDPNIHQIIKETTSEENENLIGQMEKRLSMNTEQPRVLYSLEDIENVIYFSQQKMNFMPETLILTKTYLSNNRQKGRINRLIQIATNKKIKTRIIDTDTLSGKRIQQLGGIVCIMNPE